MADVIAKHIKQDKEDWMTTKWRPMMAVTYMATIWFDFVLGPILFNILQYYNPGQAVSSWTPLTLQGGGLYHISMGAILGIAAWTRGKEKIATIENGGNGGYGQDFSQGYGSAPMSNAPQWIDQSAQYQPQQRYAPPPQQQTYASPPPGAPEQDFPDEVESPVEVAQLDPGRPLRRRRN